MWQKAGRARSHPGNTRSADRLAAGALESMRLIIVQPALPRYRVPVFDKLGKSRSVDLRIWFGTEVQQTFGFIDDPKSVPFAARRVRTRRFGPVLYHSAQTQAMKPGASDVVILPWDVRYASLFLALCRGRRRGPRVLVWGHGSGRHDRRGGRLLRKYIADRSDGIILYSDSAAKVWRSRGVLASKVHVARNALDQEPIRRAREAWEVSPESLERFAAARGTNGPVVLFCSRLTAGKGIELLIESFAMVARQLDDARLVIIGAGPLRELLGNMVSALGLDPRVSFVGALYEEMDLAPWFLTASVFAFPQRIGLSIFHAFGYGLPVVTSGDPLYRNPEYDALVPGVNGLAFDGNDASAFSRAILQLLTNPTLRQEMGEAAQRTVADGAYSLDNMVAGLLDAIQPR